MILAFVGLVIACQKDVQPPIEEISPNATARIAASPYAIVGNKITFNGLGIQFIGANAFHSFGAGGSDMKPWKLNIAREFVGNV